MTTENMNIHKALIELKMLEKRITSDIQEGLYITSIRGNQTKIKGINKDEVVLRIKADYQSVQDKMKRYDAIKNALMLSNATTLMKVNDVEYCVAEVLSKKKYGVIFKELLLANMKTQYSIAKLNAERSEVDIEDNAINFILQMFQQKDKNTKFTEEMNIAKDNYIKANQIELVDPNNIEKNIKNLQEEIDKFLSEVDSALSVSNAMTIITIEY